MKSSDGGRSWQETGRCPVRRRHYWYVGYPDGRMVRLYGATGYQNPHGDKTCTIVEESDDGGNTWRLLSTFLEGYYTNMFKFRKLSSGRLVGAVSIRPSWGPGEKIASRHLKVSGQLTAAQAAFFVSEDEGKSWTGPHYMFPGVVAWEFDFVELPGGGSGEGDLLFVNSTIQSGRPVRQIVRKTQTGYVNDPLMEIHSGAPQTHEGWVTSQGIVPESMAITGDGLLVGSLRNDTLGRPGYACSKDLGANWFLIDGAPECPYQPMTDMLPDGRAMTVWHNGFDSSFGEQDMFIGVHAFKVDASDVPAPTQLSLERKQSDNGDRYTNVFTATLTADGKPAAGKQVGLRVLSVWRWEDGRHDPRDVSESDDVRLAVTDVDGIATFHLADKDINPDMHAGYWVMPVYQPAAGDPYAPCDGARYMSYPLTSVRNCDFPYDAIMEHGHVIISPAVAEQFADLGDVIAKFDPHQPDATFDKWAQAAGSEERANQILDFLMKWHIVAKDKQGVYRWYRRCKAPAHPIVTDVKIAQNIDYCI